MRSYFYNNPVINLAGEAKKNVFIVAASSTVACFLRSKSFSKTSCRYYSTSNSDSPSSNLPPVSILTFNNLNNEDCVKSSIRLLKGKGGIYSFINTVNHHKYIGSAKDLYLRLNEHLEGKKSNSALQKAFTKYGLDKFKFCIYEYFTYESKIISQKALTDLETSYINKFNFDTLYNFKATATSSLGYKHTKEARLKMVIERKCEKSNNSYIKKRSLHPGEADVLSWRQFILLMVSKLVSRIIILVEHVVATVIWASSYSFILMCTLASILICAIINLAFCDNCIYILSVSDNISFMLFPLVLGNKKSNLAQSSSKFINMSDSEFIQWFAGFVDGEGCFYIDISSNNVISFKFTIGLHIDDKSTLEFIQKRLNCGNIYITKKMAHFNVKKINDIKNIIIPILDKFPLNGVKYLDYLAFKEAISIKYREDDLLMSNKLKLITALKISMNTKRVTFDMPSTHTIRITPYWLLGLIEGV